MSNPSRLPERPSLEQLRKQAKELIDRHRKGDAAADQRFRAVIADRGGPFALADAQFVLAREMGFENWAALKHHIESAGEPALKRYKELAENFVAAYHGDPDALEQIADHYKRGFTWEQLRSAIQQRLRLPQPSTLWLADAYRLVAEEFGFKSWKEFEVSANLLFKASRVRAGKPAIGSLEPYDIDWTTNTLRVRQLLDKADLDAVIGVMKERGIAGLTTEGLMTDRLLERLSELDHLTRLDVPASKHLTDAGLKHLARMPRLQDLDLSGCGISDSGLEVLRQLPDLRTFKLYHHQNVSDAGIAQLAGCEHLERVELMGTPTGDGAIRALAGKPRLSHLQAGNEVTDDGLALLHQYPVFKRWRGGEPQYSLMEFAAQPNYLWLNLKAPFTNEGLENLVGLNGLFALNLFGGASSAFDDSRSAVTAAGVSRLAALPHLAWLGCCARLGNDETMRHVAAMPGLRVLSCQDAVAGDEGFLALSRSTSIEYIWGRRCHNLTGRGFRAMAAMPALRGLSVSCKNVDDAALSALPRFPALREFMPMDVADAGFRHVGRCDNLEALWCMYCQDTTDQATEHIGGLPRLKSYYAGATKITDRSLEILGRVLSLERATFYACFGVTDAGLAALATLPRLREVVLEDLPNVTSEAASLFPARVRVRYA